MEHFRDGIGASEAAARPGGVPLEKQRGAVGGEGGADGAEDIGDKPMSATGPRRSRFCGSCSPWTTRSMT